MSKKKIELEDLLKLKRAERPSASDWEFFDAELKRKLVRSIVKESFSQRLLSRIATPSFAAFSFSLGVLGAVAAVAVAPSFTASFSTPSDDISFDSESSASLPQIEKSFAQNVLPAFDSEKLSLVSAQINPSEKNPVRYISSDVGPTFGGGVF